MHCPNCGTEVGAGGAKFCSNCGQSLSEPAASASAAPAPPAEPQSYSYEIEHRPSYSTATVKLTAGQSIRAEAGAMVSMSANIRLESKVEGGVMGAVKRAVASESIFQSTFTAEGADGEVVLAPPMPGDVQALELDNQAFLVQGSSYLAGDPALAMETKVGGLKSFLSGEGVFLLRLAGTGLLLVNSFGAIFKRTLAAGEKYVVDTGHIVAFEESVKYDLRKASQSGWLRSLASGEGVVAEYTGPGELYIQSRNIRAFAGTLLPFLPSQGAGGGRGLLNNLLGT